MSLFVAPNPDNLTVEQWLDTYPGCCSGKPQAVNVGGETGLRFPQDALDNNPTVVFRHNGFMFGLTGFVSSIPDSGSSPVLSDADLQQVTGGFRFGS